MYNNPFIEIAMNTVCATDFAFRLPIDFEPPHSDTCPPSFHEPTPALNPKYTFSNSGCFGFAVSEIDWNQLRKSVFLEDVSEYQLSLSLRRLSVADNSEQRSQRVNIASGNNLSKRVPSKKHSVVVTKTLSRKIGSVLSKHSIRKLKCY